MDGEYNRRPIRSAISGPVACLAQEVARVKPWLPYTSQVDKRRRNLNYVLAFLLAVSASASAQTGVEGTWQAQPPPPGQTWTMVLIVDGATVGGSVTSCGSTRVSQIYDGSIAGNTIMFKCKSPDGDRTLAFTGRIGNEEIAFTYQGQVRDGGTPFFLADKMFGPTAPPQFTAKRVSKAVPLINGTQQAGAAELKRRANEQYEALLQLIDPDLLKRAAEKGIYKREDYPVLRSMNPFFIRGDFNGDGKTDLAFWVTQRSSGLTGVAVIHSTLDKVYYLGAGHDEYGHFEKPGEVSADAWTVLPVGTVSGAFNTIPAIGAIAERPFTFRRETLEFDWLGKASFVYYWANGRYWMIVTGD